MIITRTAVPGRHDGAHARHPGIHPRLDHLAADPPRAGELAAAGQSAGHLPRRIRLRRRRPAWRRQHPAIPAPLRRLRALLRLRHLLRRPRPLRRRSPAHRPPRRNTPGSPRHRLHRPPRRHRAWTRELTLNELTGLPTKDLRVRAARFEEQYGRKPSQRELAHLAQASNFKTRDAKHGALDLAELHQGWADKLARTLGVRLASVAPSVWRGAGSTGADARTRSPVSSQLELSRAARKAVTLAQQDKSTWTRADLIKYLGRVLPRSGRDPSAAAALLEDLADRALRSEFEPVACLEAPEPAEVPASLLRADGRSIYQRHGGTRYATHAQLTLEERMLALARASGAPRMDRAHAAHALGADLAQLEAALAGRAHAAPDRSEE